METYISFGQHLFMLRQETGMSLRALAEKADVAASLISNYENERRPPPNKAAVRRLALGLGLDRCEAERLIKNAQQERQNRVGLKVPRATPGHVAALLRDLAALSSSLSPEHIRTIRQNLETTMK